MVEIAKNWLVNNYENKKDSTEIISVSGGIELEGALVIDGYKKLTKIFLNGAKKIAELKINDCPEIEIMFVSDNQITKIEGLDKLTKLKKLSFGGNKIEKIDISKNTELEMVVFFQNPKNLEFVN